MMRLFLLFFLLTYALCCNASVESARYTIENLYRKIDTITNNNSNAIAQDKIKNLIIENIDVKKISILVLGQAIKHLNAKKLKEFEDSYKNYLGKKYAKLISDNTVSMKIINAREIDATRYIIDTKVKLKKSKESIEISYLIISEDGAFKIIDIILAGSVRLAFTDREEFSYYLRGNSLVGMDNLIRKLNDYSN